MEEHPMPPHKSFLKCIKNLSLPQNLKILNNYKSIIIPTFYLESTIFKRQYTDL